MPPGNGVVLAVGELRASSCGFCERGPSSIRPPPPQWVIAKAGGEVKVQLGWTSLRVKKPRVALLVAGLLLRPIRTQWKQKRSQNNSME